MVVCKSGLSHDVRQIDYTPSVNCFYYVKLIFTWNGSVFFCTLPFIATTFPHTGNFFACITVDRRRTPVRHSKCKSNGAFLHRAFATMSASNTSENPNEVKKTLSWSEYFMAVARLSSTRSKDPKTQVCETEVSSCYIHTYIHTYTHNCSHAFVSWNPFLSRSMYSLFLCGYVASVHI